MALGNNYDNNKKNAKNDYNFTLDSSYKFYNGESTIDKTGLKFGFWNNMLKISIAPKSETTGNTNNEEFPTYDWEKATTGFISTTKAKILYHELERYIQDPSAHINVGIPLGGAGKVLYVCNGKEFGSNSLCLVILAVDENGNVQSTSVYEFKSNFHFAIRDYDAEKKSFDKIFYDNIELESVIDILREYCNAMVGAHAYSTVAGSMKYHVRNKSSFEAIASKLGVDLGYNYSNTNNNGRGNSASSFFKNNGNTSSNKPEPQFTNASLSDFEKTL